jgi:hypothetical protein
MPPSAIQKAQKANHVTRERRKLKIVSVMNRSQIEAAVERNLPFALHMADGKVYAVPHRDYIFLPPKAAFVVVSDDQGHVFVLPLLTMTGLSYDSEAADAKKA